MCALNIRAESIDVVTKDAKDEGSEEIDSWVWFENFEKPFTQKRTKSSVVPL